MSPTRSGLAAIAFILWLSGCTRADVGAPLRSELDVPCAAVGGQCVAPQACAPGAGALGSEAYQCGGSRRVCCLPDCGGLAETFECCNPDRTYAPRPLCAHGIFACPHRFSAVRTGTCLASTAANH
jgi:hypothetical protein